MACLVLVTGSLLAGGAAIAQESRETLEEITVVAPRLVTREVVGRTAVGGKVELISLTRRVNYADLNLENHADAMELEKRIDDTARESCDQLAKMFPLSDPNTPNCISEAVASAKAQKDKAVAAATTQR
jgi:UrcA family protein